MKKILVMIMLIFAFGCSDDATEPSENSIVGKWDRFYEEIADQTNVFFVIEFKANGELYFEIENSTKKNNSAKGTYTLVDNILTIEDDACEGDIGKYNLEFKDNGIELTLIEDECERGLYLPGFFKKVEGPFVSPNPIMNDAKE